MRRPGDLWSFNEVKNRRYGHAGSDLPEKEKEIAFELGKAIAEQDGITITGGSPGYPFEAAKGPASQGGLVIGISPGLSLWEHYKHPSCFLNDRSLKKNHRSRPGSITE
jgi:predicted Rossmann-fold nucleotide-binding protein